MDDADYAGAVSAIHRRDYAGALDFLQAGRLRKADDVRVLNAFGVVYDKLGRFDLSERYYLQALAIDPASAIVAGNLAYSLALQGRSARAFVRSGPDARSALGGD
jgi:Flp pilus assembly protein TadD